MRAAPWIIGIGIECAENEACSGCDLQLFSLLEAQRHCLDGGGSGLDRGLVAADNRADNSSLQRT